MHMYGLLRTEVDIEGFSPPLSILLIEKEPPTESRTHHLTSQLVWGDTLSLPPEFWGYREPPHLPGFYVGSGDQNSGPCKCLSPRQSWHP